MSDTEETGQLAYSTIQNHKQFTSVVDQLTTRIVKNKKTSLFATHLLRIACHWETQSLRSVIKPDPLGLYLALVPGAERTTLRNLLESFAPPNLLSDACFNGRYHDETIDQVATTFSRHSHFYVPAVRVEHFFSRSSRSSIYDLSAAIATAEENRGCPDRDRLKYFLVGEMPEATRTVHLIFDVGSHWVHVRIEVDDTDTGRITVHDSAVFERSADGTTLAHANMFEELPLVAALVALTPGLSWPDVAWESVEVVCVKCPQQSKGFDSGAFALYTMATTMRMDMPRSPKQGCRMYTLECVMDYVPSLPRLMRDELASQNQELDDEHRATLPANGHTDMDADLNAVAPAKDIQAGAPVVSKGESANAPVPRSWLARCRAWLTQWDIFFAQRVSRPFRRPEVTEK